MAKISIDVCEEWQDLKKESGLSWRYILKKGIEVVRDGEHQHGKD